MKPPNRLVETGEDGVGAEVVLVVTEVAEEVGVGSVTVVVEAAEVDLETVEEEVDEVVAVEGEVIVGVVEELPDKK